MAVLELRSGATVSEIIDAFERLGVRYAEHGMAAYGLLSGAEQRRLLSRMRGAAQKLLLERGVDEQMVHRVCSVKCTCPARKTSCSESSSAQRDHGANWSKPLVGQRTNVSLRTRRKGATSGREDNVSEQTSDQPAAGGTGDVSPQPARETVSAPSATRKRHRRQSTRSEGSEFQANRSLREEGQQVAITGKVLRELRRKRGVALEEISARTKVAVHHLKNIEEDSYDSLPAPIYVRGYVKEYARCLEINPSRAVDEYLAPYRNWYERSSR